MYKIRQATIEDTPEMMELIKELALYENAPEEVTVSMEEFQNLGFGPQPLWHAFVATRENNIVGMALCYFRYSTWKGKRLYLEDIVITEAHRRKGIGQLLMDACIEYGKATNCHGMVWQVLDWNDSAMSFYKTYDAEFDEEWVNVSIMF